MKAQKRKLKRACRKEPFVISAHSGKGVKEVLRALYALIEKRRGKPAKEEGAQTVAVVTPKLAKLHAASSSRSARRCSSTAAPEP